MKTIRRYDVNEDRGHTGLVEAGDFYIFKLLCRQCRTRH